MFLPVEVLSEARAAAAARREDEHGVKNVDIRTSSVV